MPASRVAILRQHQVNPGWESAETDLQTRIQRYMELLHSVEEFGKSVTAPSRERIAQWKAALVQALVESGVEAAAAWEAANVICPANDSSQEQAERLDALVAAGGEPATPGPDALAEDAASTHSDDLDQAVLDRQSNFLYHEVYLEQRALDDYFSYAHYLAARALVRGCDRVRGLDALLAEFFPRLRCDVAAAKRWAREGALDTTNPQQFLSDLYSAVPGALRLVGALVTQYSDLVNASRGWEAAQQQRDLPIEEPLVEGAALAPRLRQRVINVYRVTGSARLTARAFRTRYPDTLAALVDWEQRQPGRNQQRPARHRRRRVVSTAA